MISRFLRLWAIFLPVAALISVPESTWARPINVGSVNTQPASEIKKFLPIASYLAKHLQSEGIDEGKVVVAKNIPEMASLFREGKVDVYIDTLFPALAVSRLSGSKLLLRRWKKGVGEYHTVIFTRTDSNIDRIEDLTGKLIALEEPYSTSGYFLPKVALLQQGFKVVLKTEGTNPVEKDEMGYVFTRADDATMMWVLRGRAHAGAMDNHSYLKEARDNLSSLKILYKTFSIPRQVVSHRGDLTVQLVAKIKEILLNMQQSEEGKKTLQIFENTTKFDDVPEQSLAPLLKLQGFIDAEFGIK